MREQNLGRFYTCLNKTHNPMHRHGKVRSMGDDRTFFGGRMTKVRGLRTFVARNPRALRSTRTQSRFLGGAIGHHPKTSTAPGARGRSACASATCTFVSCTQNTRRSGDASLGSPLVTQRRFLKIASEGVTPFLSSSRLSTRCLSQRAACLLLICTSFKRKRLCQIYKVVPTLN